MRQFGYVRPGQADSALRAAADGDARYLGGGTNLIDLMKLGVEAPGLLVDVTGLPYDQIAPTPAGGLMIGATVLNSDLAADPRSAGTTGAGPGRAGRRVRAAA